MFGGTTSVSGGLEAPLETQIGVGVVLTTPPRHFMEETARSQERLVLRATNRERTSNDVPVVAL